MNRPNHDPHEDPLAALFARAREAGPRDTAREAFGFETRLTARLAAARPSPGQAFAVWPWRLLPFFAVVAIWLTWTTWSTDEENELAIRSGLEEKAAEWAYVKDITGRTL